MRIPALILVLVVAVFVASCGGDEQAADGTNASAGTAPPRTKDEYIERAEEICVKTDERANEEVADYREKHAKDLKKLKAVPREEKVARAVVLPAVRTEVEELKSLEVPKSEGARIKALFANIDSEIEKAKKYPQSLSLEGPVAYAFLRYAELARRYGFAECRILD